MLEQLPGWDYSGFALGPGHLHDFQSHLTPFGPAALMLLFKFAHEFVEPAEYICGFSSIFMKHKKTVQMDGFVMFGGEGGIRTHGRLPYAGFQDRFFRPAQTPLLNASDYAHTAVF